MPIFAHTETQKALQPFENKAADEYLGRFTKETTKSWIVVQVPMTTQNGATFDAQGNYYNPDGSSAMADGSIVDAPATQAPPIHVPKTIGQNDLTAWLQAIAAKIGITLPPITGT